MGKHIAVVINQYIGGGAERVTDIIARGLIARGYKITLIVSELHQTQLNHAYAIYSDIKFLPGLGRYTHSATLTLANTLSEIGAESLILLVDDYPDIPLLRNAMPQGATIIYHPHNAPFYQVIAKTSPTTSAHSGAITKLKTFLLKKLPEAIFHKYSIRYRKRAESTAANVDAYLLLSDGDTELMRREYPAYSNKFSTMPNPLTCNIPDILPDKRNEIVYIGRLDPIQKRVDRLLEIFARTCTDFPNWRLRIVGNGPDEQHLKALVNALGISNHVDFCGYSSNPSSYLSTAAILCLTSEYEGFGLVLLEAMAHNCVPVSFDCGNGVRDLLSDGRGVLIKPGSIDSYVSHLKELMRSPELRAHICAQHNSFIAEYSNKAICDKWELLIEPSK